MRTSRVICTVVASIAIAGCGDSLVLIQRTTDASMRFINASSSPVDVLVDRAAVAYQLAPGSVSERIGINAGARDVHFQNAAGATADARVDVVIGTTVNTIAYSNVSPALIANVLSDTGSIVPAGKSKLRVAHLAASAGNIEIWRTQPDFQMPVRIMTPFPYQAVSPYLQSAPGPWEVFITPAGSTTRIATTGIINIDDGRRRTVVLLDRLGVLRLRVIEE